MFIIVNRIGDSITGSLNGKSYGVKFSQAKYDAMKAIAAKAADVESVDELNALIEEFKPLTTESYKELVETASEYLFVNEATGKFFLQVGGKVSKVPVPQPLVDRIISSVEQGNDVLPIVKAWGRFLRNPKFTQEKARRFVNYVNKTYFDSELYAELIKEHGVSEEVAKERATVFQTPITAEGLICTYKVSTEITKKYALDEDGKKTQVDRYPSTKTIDEDSGEITVQKGTPEFIEDRVFAPVVMGNGGDAFLCGDKAGHVIRVGQRHRLEDWNQVDCNDSRSCVKGLHTGNLDYIRGYQSEGTVTHNVFVDPMNIGAITDDGSGALRVLEYFVHGSFAGVNKSIYHSSKYAKVTDAAYEALFQQAIADSDKKAAEVAEANDDRAALRSI